MSNMKFAFNLSYNINRFKVTCIVTWFRQLSIQFFSIVGLFREDKKYTGKIETLNNI